MLTYARAVHVFTTPHGNPVTMHYRTNTNDWNTLWASLNEDEYQLPSGLTGTAVDVGGYLGSVGIGLALDNPGMRVIIVEPVPPNCELIRENIEANGVGDRVSLIEGAVGKSGMVSVWYGYRGTEAMEHHAFVGNSSLAYAKAGKLKHETVRYKVTTLAQLVKLAGRHIDYLKIDTEGAEWAFLDSPAVMHVISIFGEWHPVMGHVRDDLLPLLDKTHEVTFSGPEGGPGGFRAVRR